MCSTNQETQKRFDQNKQPRQIVVVTGGNSDLDSTLVREGSSAPEWKVLQLPSPSNSNEQREYIQLGNNRRDVFELQGLVATEFGSCFVENHVVGSPILHVMSRIDPLFWVLTIFPPDYQAQSWEPLEQLLTCQNDDNLSSILMQQDTMQWLHFFQVLNMAIDDKEDDDENVYKFRPEKALKWLQRKQKSVYQHLITQKQSVAQKKKSNRGAFSSSFQLSTTAHTSNNTMPTSINSTDVPASDTPALNQKLWRESIQIVCTYLPSAWVLAFLKSLGKQDDVDAVLWEKESSGQKTMVKRQKNDGGSSSSQSDNDITGDRNKENNEQTSTKQQPKRAVSHGIKKLAKVDKSGMKTMMHFFAKKK